MDTNAVKYFGDFIVGVSYSDEGLKMAVDVFYLSEDERKRVKKVFPDAVNGEKMVVNLNMPGKDFNEVKKQAINAITNIQNHIKLSYMNQAIKFLKKFDYKEGSKIEKDDSALVIQSGEEIRIMRREGPFSLKPSKFIEYQTLDMKFREEGGVFNKGMYTDAIFELLDEADEYNQRAILLAQEEDFKLAYRDHERARRILNFCYNKTIPHTPTVEQVETLSVKLAESLYNRAVSASRCYDDLGKSKRMFERTLDRLVWIGGHLNYFSKPEDIELTPVEEVIDLTEMYIEDYVKEADFLFQTENYVSKDQTLKEIPIMERLEFIKRNSEFMRFYKQQLKRLNNIGNTKDFLGFKLKNPFIF